MNQFLAIVQIVVAILLTIFILLQKQGGGGLGSAFGGGGGNFYATKRGLEKKIFWATIFLAVIFVVLALLNLFL